MLKFVSERMRHSPWLVTLALIAAVSVVVPGCGEEAAPPGGIGAGVEFEEKKPAKTELNYELAEKFTPGLERLLAVEAASPDRIYAGGLGGVAVLDGEGSVLARWGTAKPVECLAVADDGTVYAGLKTRVIAYSPDGTEKASWGSAGDDQGGLGYVTDLAPADGYIYVADSGSCVVRRFSVGGDFVENIGQGGDDGGAGLVCPSVSLECEVAEDGRLYVANIGRLRVEKYDRNARLESFWGSFGSEPENFVGCCNPVSFCLMPKDRLATAEKGIVRVKIYNRQGDMLDYLESDLFAAETADLDLAADGEGTLYVADPGDGRIKIFRQAEDAPSGGES